MTTLRPSLPLLCLLLALPAGAVAGRAEPAHHAPPDSAHSPAPADSAGHAAPALAGHEQPEPPQPLAEHPADPAHEKPAPAPADAHVTPSGGLTAPAEKSANPAAAEKTAAARAADTEHEEVLGLQKLGTSLTERGDWDAAEIAFRQILVARRAGADDLANALFGLARVYRKSGSLTKAAAIYERFLKDYPTDEHVPDALLELGRTHRALGAHQLAIARFYSVINSTLKLSDEGFSHYQMLAKTAQFEIAETHFQLGDFAEANKFFSRLRLLDLAPADRARAHFKSAYALFLGKDYDGAVGNLHSYLEQWPEDENVPEARYLLALSLRTLGRKQEALEATLALLRSQQATGDAKRWSYWQRRTGNQLANDFFQAGDTANALAVYQGLASLSTDPNWRLPIAYQIGLCYERMRLSERAVTAYQSIVAGARPGAIPADPKAPDAAKPAPVISPELTELARMAAWRLSQLSWQDTTERQLTGMFNSGTLPPPKTPLATPPPSTMVEGTANATPTPAATSPVHDQSGNPPAASPGL
jgi:TolA-binding protein